MTQTLEPTVAKQSAVQSAVQSLHVAKETLIQASPADVFAAVLEQIGPGFDQPGDGAPMPMVVEPWPGGRWYRDLGNNAGHFWGHVQVIKPPLLLELCGPMFMSFPVASHVQYRLTPEGDACRLTITHRALGEIPDEMHAQVGAGWDYILKRIVDRTAR